MVLVFGVCAVLAGAATFITIAEWAHDLAPAVRVGLGLGRTAPSESTIRRVLHAVDAEALDRVVSAWLMPHSAPSPAALRMIAIDGKSARGARDPTLVRCICSQRSTSSGSTAARSVVMRLVDLQQFSTYTVTLT